MAGCWTTMPPSCLCRSSAVMHAIMSYANDDFVSATWLLRRSAEATLGRRRVLPQSDPCGKEDLFSFCVQRV